MPGPTHSWEYRDLVVFPQLPALLSLQTTAGGQLQAGRAPAVWREVTEAAGNGRGAPEECTENDLVVD